MLGEIDKDRLKTGKHKVKVRYFPGARTNDMHESTNSEITGLHHFAHWNK